MAWNFNIQETRIRGPDLEVSFKRRQTGDVLFENSPATSLLGHSPNRQESSLGALVQ